MNKIIIRKARISDAKELLCTLKEVVKDSRWLLTEPDEIPNSIKKEREFIKRSLISKNSLLAVVLYNGEMIGMFNAEGGPRRRNAHVVVVGIGIRKKWQNMGIGTKMMKYLFRWARYSGIKK